MIESAEPGRDVSSAVYETAVPKRYEALIDTQFGPRNTLWRALHEAS